MAEAVDLGDVQNAAPDARGLIYTGPKTQIFLEGGAAFMVGHSSQDAADMVDAAESAGERVSFTVLSVNPMTEEIKIGGLARLRSDKIIAVVSTGVV